MWGEQKHDKLSLIISFVNFHQGILSLTTEYNIVADIIYVAYRKPIPDEETVNIVKKELIKNNIEYSELADWPMENC
jgi:hypothetical protein